MNINELLIESINIKAANFKSRRSTCKDEYAGNRLNR